MYKEFKKVGDVFEDEVSYKISVALKGLPYKLIRNAHIYSDEINKETEVDLLLLTPMGVFVIEVKSYRTYVIGDVDGRVWTGSSGRYRTVFLNPLKQNLIHRNTYLKKMKEVNGINNLNIVDLVCFRNSCDINVSSNKAVNLDRLIEIIARTYLTFKRRYKVNELYINTLKILEVEGIV